MTEVQCQFTAHFTPIKVLGISSVKIFIGKMEVETSSAITNHLCSMFLSPPGSLHTFMYAYFFPGEKTVQMNAASPPRVGAYLERILSNASKEQQ